MILTKEKIVRSFCSLIDKIHEKVDTNLFTLAGAICFFLAGLIQFSDNNSGLFFVIMIVCSGACGHLLFLKKKGEIVRSVSPVIFGLTLFFLVLKISILVASGPAKQTVEPKSSSYFEQSE